MDNKTLFDKIKEMSLDELATLSAKQNTADALLPTTSRASTT